ncbi:inositol monophosphatase family protein [Lentibacillus cibarius]|uniref:inositol-phosphate phosphatase n=1 Tax=Lentibacillus cibarius TaxID=2583219 RepID=A0A549YK73_9BACI|nr:inositol monophosphatase family protein [Lentibacillus cibarius]TRM12267.1 inositol monophosphatase family protein [Lentibacillus cibarius]
MNMQERNAIYQLAREWVLEAGQAIRKRMNTPLTIETKADANDLVTTMDKDTEYFFMNNIKKVYPDHLIIGEEGYGDDVTSLDGTVWIIDPIDGTMNFVHQKRNFAISVGIYHDGVGEIGLIYDVMADHLYSAKKGEGAFKNDTPLTPLPDSKRFDEAILGVNHFWLCENHLVNEKKMQELVRTVRGTRTYGSAALEFAYVAEGVMDGYIAMGLSAWDIAAGIVIVKEVGGVTTTSFGEPINLLQSASVLTCNPVIHERIVNGFMLKGRK